MVLSSLYILVGAQCSFNKIDSTSNSTGAVSGLMIMGVDREALFARIVAYSINDMVKFNQTGSRF